MSNEKELKQFDDYDYDELFKNEYPHTDTTSFGTSSRKYWTLYGKKLSDDPLETINRARFMVEIMMVIQNVLIIDLHKKWMKYLTMHLSK